MLQVQKNNLKILDDTPISANSLRLLYKLLAENAQLKSILDLSNNLNEVRVRVRSWVMQYMIENPEALAYYNGEATGKPSLEKLKWQDLAAIRLLDYLDNAGRYFDDLNIHGARAITEPFKMIWLAYHEGLGGAQANFFKDMIQLFRQFNCASRPLMPDKEKLIEWMGRYHSGLDPEIIKIREQNKARIISILARKIDKREMYSPKFQFSNHISWDEKIALVNEWWESHIFHLKFAVRDPYLLNELLGFTLEDETMNILHKASRRGIPFFINPYYLSLLNADVPEFAKGADLAIRYYILYSKQLVEEFGHIVAWEKEDLVEPGKPNAAGWILPTRHNVHRRYPEVAILIPDTTGRACGGLCASCQRMYDFQRGNLNFDLDKLKPGESWDIKLAQIMKYWENDSRLRDVLITGGDALMNSDKSLIRILNAVYEMAERKIETNKKRSAGNKFAEIQRVRLGSRLPVYLPQRITPALVDILSDFKKRASAIGIKQFVVQTHFQSPMEITPEARQGIERLTQAGWMVVNQLVFTAIASRRGHAARLRKELNDIGVMPYYTFSVKGYMENMSKFATNARAAQEQIEEKVFGELSDKYYSQVKSFSGDAENIRQKIDKIRLEAGLPFIATDRNVLNLPGVGKSMTYRVIGITRHGRRILEFDHDHTRSHSPIIKKLGKFVIIESKSIAQYLEQLEEMGEDSREYQSIWGYSIGETEPRPSLYDYPDLGFEVTPEITHFQG